jgi:pilus assembly protein FimV
VPAASSAPTFDDNTIIDDDFDFDFDADSAAPIASPTAVSVASDVIELDLDYQEEDTASTTEFSTQFAADFDFVKGLDGSQVTLELAAQYLQLGEYDSAKRLLSEVISQGNSEQQQQAEQMLARTA